MSNLKQEIKDLETEYRLQKKHLEADGVLDASDKQQLSQMKAVINKVKAELKKKEAAEKAVGEKKEKLEKEPKGGVCMPDDGKVQDQSKTPKEQNKKETTKTPVTSEEPEEFSKLEMDDGRDKADISVDSNGKVTLSVEADAGDNQSAILEVDTDGNYKVGGKEKLTDKTTVGLTVDQDGKTTGTVEHEINDKTKVGLEVSSDGSFKASGEHEFESGVIASAELTNEKAKIALGKKFESPEVSHSFYLIPPGAIAGAPIALKAGVIFKASASIAATEEIDFKQGVSKIGIKATGAASGALRLYVETGGLFNTGIEGSLTGSITGIGNICYNGSEVYPEASITGAIVATGSVFVGFSDPIIEGWKSLGGKRSELELKFPLKSLELYKFTGIKIEKGKITGKPQFSDGKDLAAIRNQIKQSVQYIVNKYNQVKEKINEVIEEGKKVYDNSVDATTDGFHAAEDGLRSVVGDDLVDQGKDMLLDTYDSVNEFFSDDDE